jgi:hypothetical protein
MLYVGPKIIMRDAILKLNKHTKSSLNMMERRVKLIAHLNSPRWRHYN